jgi:glycine/serine hydroxymethyltransferase
MDEKDMDEIAHIITMVIESSDNVAKARDLVAELVERYPLD